MPPICLEEEKDLKNIQTKIMSKERHQKVGSSFAVYKEKKKLS